jgi:hypothetical protein
MELNTGILSIRVSNKYIQDIDIIDNKIKVWIRNCSNNMIEYNLDII